MANWMHNLAAHYDAMRRRYPDDELAVAFDIDGTIIDTRSVIVHLLHQYDQVHGTRYFGTLKSADVVLNDRLLDDLLVQFSVPHVEHDTINQWYREQRWSPEAIVAGHRPVRGALEVLRWFQIQPRTRVALITARPETVRTETLRSLNEFGRQCRVQFDSDWLLMNTLPPNGSVAQAKVAAVAELRSRGMRIVALIDNEPDNLEAIAQANDAGEILLLHADTIFESKRRRAPRGVARGTSFNLTDLATEDRLPQNVQLVWHGVNTEANLRQFLTSQIRWAEIDVRADPRNDGIIFSHDAPVSGSVVSAEPGDPLPETLARLKAHGRAVKIDFKEGGAVVDRVLTTIANCGFAEDALWFNGNVETLTEAGFRMLNQAYPQAVLQCPVDPVASVALSHPDDFRAAIAMYTGWGINRFSVGWRTPERLDVITLLQEWNYAVNIYDVPDLASFLQAVLLLPQSVTSDFNFPQWHYYGLGSGEKGERIRYTMRQTRQGRR